MSDSTVSWNITRCSELDLDFQTLERTMKSILCAAAFLTASSAGAAQINANDGFGNPILVSDNPYWAGDPTISQQSSKSYAANSGNSSGNQGSSSTGVGGGSTGRGIGGGTGSGGGGTGGGGTAGGGTGGAAGGGGTS